MKIVIKNEQDYDAMKAKNIDLFILRRNGYNVAGMIFAHRDHGFFMIDMKDGWSFTSVCDSPMDCVEEVLKKGYKIIKVIDSGDLELVEV